ncbi:amino acid ABC transporter substrate-binding protein [Ferrimonas marina]|uniref:Putative amino-acid transport system substrate-binding protein n=1 Tax=Ferrimonas marina TaxID=299255 RepID=A0A1M5P4A0_9GAMM|nr:amino acid ABC transporter substrate-binding protein [Ferrimonas marina]SHG96568.1 putative amino-acid transport system substrate-binding protein [Ferrimonas marina]
MMKQWFTSFVLVATSLLGGAQAAHASDGAVQINQVKVGMSGRYFPFTFSERGELKGFEVDLWNEIGERNGYQVEFVTASFSGLFGMLETGRIDTISNQITVTEERQARYQFAEPYVIDGAQVVVRRGNDSINGLEDLSGKVVAVNLGSNFEQLLRNSPNADQITIRTYDAGIEQDVALGRADAFVMDRLSAKQLIKESNLPLQLAGDTFTQIESAWPFRMDKRSAQLKTEVNTALAAMRADGTLAKISVKWFDVDITE